MIRTSRFFALLTCISALLFPLQLSGTTRHDCHGPPVGAPASTEKGHEEHPSGGPAPHGSTGGASHESSGMHHPAAHHHGSTASVEWQVDGRYLDACRCNAPCPCHFGVRADYDTCDPTLVFHITAGRFGQVRLDGLTAVVVASKEMARLYIDDRGDPAQQRALEEVARAMTATLLRRGFKLAADQVVSVRPIHAALSDERATVSIPGVLEISAGWLVGGDGRTRIILQNLNLGPSWMTRAWAGRSEVYRYADARTWDYSGRNAYFGLFRAGSAAPTGPPAGRSGR